ncbi:MAG TPA: glucose dehydrogenase [Syntrophaceae bacterium]|jgi:glucose/arabinose dehydrogenase|nr:glucose dehydrogenase [Syntrophaceae bacterium]
MKYPFIAYQWLTRLLCALLLIQLFSVAASCTQIAGGKAQSVEDVFLPDGDTVTVEVWVKNLEVPWSLVFLPDGRALVSERPGRIRLIQDGHLQEKPYLSVDAARVGEAGLMGIAVHPQFPMEPYIYAMYTYRKGGDLLNRVARFRDRGGTGSFDRVIIDTIPGARFHDGGRIAFGPDGMLYVTTGENFISALAQDLSSLAGKVLRVTPEGNIPADNPFIDSPVYSYGHRNPQGIAWQPDTGRLFESEHGPSGEFGRFAHDEINIITKGGNYGWPHVIGSLGKEPYIDPIIVWKETTPPGGITFYKGNLLGHLRGDLFVATLRSRALVRIKFDADTRIQKIERWFAQDFKSGRYGRLRDVVSGPDGALYFTSSNRDGRGNPASDDDKIYRIVPKK